MSVAFIRPVTRPSAVGGIMIVAGTAVGAGMFSIPVITAGVWYSGSVILLIYTWFGMLISGLMILEVILHYPHGASFHTTVKDLLGCIWSFVNGLTIIFVLYILTYAYISACSSVITHTLEKIINIDQRVAGLIFTSMIALAVWSSTSAVDRLSTILIGGMIVAFFISAGNMFMQVKADILFDRADKEASYLPYALATLPWLLTSFGYHGNVPGLVKYYNKESQPVVCSLLYGTLITLTIYILWQYVIQGNIPRHAFIQVISDGGNIGSLLEQMGTILHSQITSQLLDSFSYMALTSSFLGVSLGLFDYIADFFQFNDSATGRAQSALITFVPPTIGAILSPDGFLYAIGFAGLAGTIWAVIVPALMVKASRRRFLHAHYRAPGGNFMIYFIILFGIINATAHVANLFGWLPYYH